MYPMAIFVGAASMLPGGVGLTEEAIVTQLKWHDFDTSETFFGNAGDTFLYHMEFSLLRIYLHFVS